MSGKVLGISMVVFALIFGAVVYYMQEYAYYEPVAADSPAAEIRLTAVATGVAEPVPADDVRAIDANSSPVRFRACFKTPLTVPLLTETYRVYEKPVPLVAPKSFDCFDANAIGEALERGDAFAFLGQANITYGIDRVIAIFPDGRGYVWNQINHCGEVVFDGKPVPDGCPPPPESD